MSQATDNPARGEHVIKQRVWVPRPRDEVFEFFAAAENLGRITPPELSFRIRSDLPIDMHAGAIIDYQIGLYGVPMKWRTEITAWNPPSSFEDTQIAGPYRKWIHLHQFFEDGGGTVIVDRVAYSLPWGHLGRVSHPIVARQLRRIFMYREEVLTGIFKQ